MDDTEKAVYRFNWAFTLMLIVALLLDIGLVWGFARIFTFLRAL